MDAISALVVNPGKRRKSKRKGGGGKRRRSAPRRSNVLVPVLPNRGHRRRRRDNQLIPLSNPLGGGMIRRTMSVGVPAVLGGLGMGFIDAKWLGGRGAVVRTLAKVAIGAVGGGLLRRNPVAASAVMASAIGSIGYDFGVRLGGGVVAASKKAGMKELAAMAAEEEEIASLLDTELRGYGMSLLVETQSGMGDDDDMGADDDIGQDRAYIDGEDADEG